MGQPCRQPAVVEVHFYDPYDYTLNATGSCLYWGAPYPTQSACGWAQENWVDDQFSKIKAKWVDKGIPVIIGEYGVIKRTSLGGQQLTDHLASRRFYLKYVNAAAAKNGIKTFYWDNGVKGDKGLALLDRDNGSVVDQGALDAIMQGAGAGKPSVNYTLTTTVSGSGTGTVTRAPNGTSYPSGTSVTLTATAASGSTFAGWSGACSGTGTETCTVTMTAAQSVAATFTSSGLGCGVTGSESLPLVVPSLAALLIRRRRLRRTRE